MNRTSKKTHKQESGTDSGVAGASSPTPDAGFDSSDESVIRITSESSAANLKQNCFDNLIE